MAQQPQTSFRTGGSCENSDRPYIANYDWTGNPPGAQNMGIFHQPSNFTQMYIPQGQPPSIQPSGFNAATTTRNDNGSRLNMPPYMPCVQWSNSWNSTGVPSYHPGVQQVGVVPSASPGAVARFDRSVPPPMHRYTTPPAVTQLGLDQGTNAGNFFADRIQGSSSPGGRDRMWIDSWTLHHPGQGPQHLSSLSCSGENMKVWQVKQLLQRCLSLLRELEGTVGDLEESSREMCEVEWSGKLADVEMKKQVLGECLGMLNEGAVSSVKRVLWKRARKRSRQKQRQLVDQEAEAERAEKRKRAHLEADMWLEQKQAEVDLLKREEALKREADAVLWEVRRKQSEGRRILSLLTALVKLHQVRVKKNDPASNPALCENEDQFQIIIDKLSSLWERQMSEYEVEERALQVMLRESPEGGKGRVLKATGDLQRSLRLWETLLFGGSGPISHELQALGVSECQRLYLQPSKSLDALVDNRRQWDQFISTSSSATSIPVGWVIPAEASSEEWKALIG